GESKDGRVELNDLEVGVYDVTVRAKGCVPRFFSGRVTSPPTVTRLELQRADASIVGRIENENGQPVAGAQVYLLGADGRVASPQPECRTKSDAEGNFHFREV